jgi:hypothetical protein
MTIEHTIVPCAECRGEGQDDNGNLCWQCNGSGTISVVTGKPRRLPMPPWKREAICWIAFIAFLAGALWLVLKVSK